MISPIVVAAVFLFSSVGVHGLIPPHHPNAISRDDPLFPLGTNCTTDAQCESSKCFPTSWYYGQTICSPAAAGHACGSDTDCVSRKYCT